MLQRKQFHEMEWLMTRTKDINKHPTDHNKREAGYTSIPVSQWNKNMWLTFRYADKP